jgi:hypothetical protein
MEARLGCCPKVKTRSFSLIKSPAINLAVTIALQCLVGLKLPSAALYVVELMFAGAFESHSLRHIFNDLSWVPCRHPCR